MNSIVHELLKGFKPKFTQIFPTVGPLTDYVLKVVGSKVKVTDNILKMHLLAEACGSTKTIVDDHLVRNVSNKVDNAGHFMISVLGIFYGGSNSPTQIHS